MKIERFSCPDRPLPVPVAQIEHTSRSFPHAELVAEVQFNASTSCDALIFCGETFRAAGIVLCCLRCSEDGIVFCKLRLLPDSDLGILNRAIAGALDITLTSWTTVLTFGGEERQAADKKEQSVV